MKLLSNEGRRDRVLGRPLHRVSPSFHLVKEKSPQVFRTVPAAFQRPLDEILSSIVRRLPGKGPPRLRWLPLLNPINAGSVGSLRRIQRAAIDFDDFSIFVEWRWRRWARLQRRLLGNPFFHWLRRVWLVYEETHYVFLSERVPIEFARRERIGIVNEFDSPSLGISLIGWTGSSIDSLTR